MVVSLASSTSEQTASHVESTSATSARAGVEPLSHPQKTSDGSCTKVVSFVDSHHDKVVSFADSASEKVVSIADSQSGSVVSFAESPSDRLSAAEPALSGESCALCRNSPLGPWPRAAIITAEMRAAHRRACQAIEADPTIATSHTVMVVDQSGSMRTRDVADAPGLTRSATVWRTLALEYVAQQLQKSQAKATDVVSLIVMHDTSSLVFSRQPTDWLLYNRLVRFLNCQAPRSHGCYLPALNLAEVCLLGQHHGGCALLLLFLSDGRPSDLQSRSVSLEVRQREQKGVYCGCDSKSVLQHRWKTLAGARIAEVASRLGRRLTVGTVAFGADADYEVLRHMASVADAYGSAGLHENAAGSKGRLTNALLTLSSSLTKSATELTDVAGGRRRTVRDVRRELRDLSDGPAPDDTWDVYTHHDVHRVVWAGKGGWQPTAYMSPAATGIAMRKCIFGEGAERMVRKFREVGADGRFVGPELVAKESRYIEDLNNTDLKQFHSRFCQTQMEARKFAEDFNEALATVLGADAVSPRLTPPRPFSSCIRGRAFVLSKIHAQRG